MGGARCKFVPCYEVGHCEDAPPSLTADVEVEEFFEDDELWTWDETIVDLNEFLVADARGDRTPRSTRGPKPTKAPKPAKTPRPAKEPRTPRPTDEKTPRPTREPRTPKPTNWGLLSGCESITRQDFCEGVIRPECVWKKGYPKHLNFELSVENGLFFESSYLQNVDSVNLMMVFGILLVVFVCYLCTKFLKQKNAKDALLLDEKGYSSYQTTV